MKVECSTCEFSKLCLGKVLDPETFREVVSKMPRDCVEKLRERLRKTNLIRVGRVKETIRKIHEVEGETV